ncbi:redoxin domain-containing protein [Sphingomonas solaris]|uniref:Redoxin domain-containing protein n=1 Tax=Alterirhizorhabdus solaris TaxID=2529389 RepID=A0A558R8W1_9SPHN|nr:redoxin domain-containing protein [Sphingomonas solaris]TVV75768.1 redoxin domain-containing protein [Sphingomonas solaris]
MRHLIALAALTLATPALAAPEVGRPAPPLALTDATGKPVRLADYRGRTVVLEWNNPGCPFVQKHYAGGNMQRTQATARKGGAVWLTINSGAPGKQGHMTGAQAAAFVAQEKAQPTAYLLDPQGIAGRAYAARATPQLFVVDGRGTLVYMGGIDDKPTSDPADIATARNHVLAALAEMRAGKPVSQPVTRPYGCAVKYAG